MRTTSPSQKLQLEVITHSSKPWRLYLSHVRLPLITFYTALNCMPYFLLYLPACLVQNLTHEMCAEIELSREDRGRDSMDPGQPITSSGILSTLFISAKGSELHLSVYLDCIFLWL